MFSFLRKSCDPNKISGTINQRRTSKYFSDTTTSVLVIVVKPIQKRYRYKTHEIGWLRMALSINGRKVCLIRIKTKQSVNKGSVGINKPILPSVMYSILNDRGALNAITMSAKSKRKMAKNATMSPKGSKLNSHWSVKIR